MSQPVRSIDNRDEWSERLLKVLPAEVTGVYLFARSLRDVNVIDYDYDVFSIFVILFVMLPVFNWYVLKIRGRKQLFVMSCTFLIWAFNIDLVRLSRSSFGFLSKIDLSFWAPVSMGLWIVILVPIIFSHRNWEEEVSASVRQPADGSTTKGGS